MLGTLRSYELWNWCRSSEGSRPKCPWRFTWKTPAKLKTSERRASASAFSSCFLWNSVTSVCRCGGSVPGGLNNLICRMLWMRRIFPLHFSFKKRLFLIREQPGVQPEARTNTATVHKTQNPPQQRKTERPILKHSRGKWKNGLVGEKWLHNLSSGGKVWHLV